MRAKVVDINTARYRRYEQHMARLSGAIEPAVGTAMEDIAEEDFIPLSIALVLLQMASEAAVAGDISERSWLSIARQFRRNVAAAKRKRRRR